MRTILWTSLVLSSSLLAQRAGDPWERILQSDKNSDGKVTKVEFRGPERIFSRFDTNKDGVLTQDEVAKVHLNRKVGPAGNGDGGVRGGGFARPDNAPKVGDLAPQVSAKKLKGTEKVDLGKPKNVTVLIFGSYT